MTPHPKPITHTDKKYELWLRSQACVACGNKAVDGYRGIVPCHTGGGIAKKGDSKMALPLCVYCHAEEHRGFKTFWERVRRKTGKSRGMHAEEAWGRYQEERKYK